MRSILNILMITCMMVLASVGIYAQTDTIAKGAMAKDTVPDGPKRALKTRTYKGKDSLVYVGMWDLWPYSFVGEDGKAEGFSVELIDKLLKKLDIPYKTRMTSMDEAFEELRDGKADLMMGLAAGFHDEYGLYSKNAVTLFTQSVASPKGTPVQIQKFKDLGTYQVIVYEGSFCHHLMVDYGLGENALPTNDIKQSLFNVSAEGKGYIVWNTLSLNWLIKKYKIDNLQVTPIHMPHGEYKFMSNDPVLLAQLDSVFGEMDSKGELEDLRNKWFYPDRAKEDEKSHLWWEIGGGIAGLLALILLIYAIIYHIQGRRVDARNNIRNKRLALILETSHIRLWTYEIATQLFTWLNENGQVAYTYTTDEFAHRYRPDDFKKLSQALGQLSEKPKGENEREEDITLNIKARDTEDGDAEEKDFVIVLSVLRRDKNGRATVILGTKKDVTEQRVRQREAEEGIQRYVTLFNMPMMGNIRFTADGLIANINPKACEMFGCEREEILNERVSYRELLDIWDVDINHADGYTCTRTFDFAHPPKQGWRVHSCRRAEKITCEIQLVTFKNEEGEILGMIASCKDLTLTIKKSEERMLIEKDIQSAKQMLDEYYSQIDTILQDGGIRIANYSPVSHTLTIFSRMNQVQHILTQTRCMTLIDEEAEKKAMHIFYDMDALADKEIRFDLRTHLRPKGDHPLSLRFSFIPIHDPKGQVTEYFGLCQDITRQKAVDHQLMQEAKKVQEVENTKTSFINNMVQEIRIPMDTIVKAATHLHVREQRGDDESNADTILKNSNHLLHLFDNILYLSRLEAGMIEIVKKPSDFVDTFTTYCVAGRLNNSDITFTTESPYDQLVVNIDAQKVGNIIERVVENAVQHTHHGFIRVRYDYIGRRLMLSVEDTGEGISPKKLARINEQVPGNARTSSGLGIPICKELLAQMGGYMDINSEEGVGTTVWITLPCQASEIKRKKIV